MKLIKIISIESSSSLLSQQLKLLSPSPLPLLTFKKKLTFLIHEKIKSNISILSAQFLSSQLSSFNFLVPFKQPQISPSIFPNSQHPFFPPRSCVTVKSSLHPPCSFLLVAPPSLIRALESRVTSNHPLPNTRFS